MKLLSIALRRSLFSPAHLDQLALGQKYQLPVVIITLASAAGPRAALSPGREGSLKVTTGTGEQRARGVISNGVQLGGQIEHRTGVNKVVKFSHYPEKEQPSPNLLVKCA